MIIEGFKQKVKCLACERQHCKPSSVSIILSLTTGVQVWLILS